MKKPAILLFTTLLMLVFAGIALAAPEPTRLIEVFRKPGVNFRPFKSVGNEISVNIRPEGESFFDASDPFLRERIAEMTLNAAKQQGWVLTENSNADIRLAVKIAEWGRFRNKHDQNLMEFFTIEVNAHSRESDGLILRARGRYSRVDPVEESTNQMHIEFLSIMAEILRALQSNR